VGRRGTTFHTVIHTNEKFFFFTRIKGIKQIWISVRTVTAYLACVLEVHSSNLKYEVVLSFLVFFVKPFKGMSVSKRSSPPKTLHSNHFVSIKAAADAVPLNNIHRSVTCI